MPLLIAKIANCVWDSEKPRAISEKQTHPRRVAVWCGFWAEGVIGPYFFEKEAGRAATVNGALYRDAITRFFLPKFDDIDAADTWFRRDDATCHAANETIRLPHETFPARVLSRFGDQNWIVRFNAIRFLLTGLFEAKDLRRRSQSRMHYERKLNDTSTKFSHNCAER